MAVEQLFGGSEISGPELLAVYSSVIFDLDNVVIDSPPDAVAEFKVELVKRLGGDVDLNFEASEVERFNQMIYWAVERGLTEEEAKILQREIWDSDEVLIRAEPIPGALEIIKWLSEDGKDLHYATSRPHFLSGTTEEWVRNHPEIDEDKLHIRNEEHEIDGIEFKGQTIKGIAKIAGGALFIEDSPHQTRRILEITKKENVYGILVPYARIQASSELIEHPRLTVIARNSNDQGLWEVYRFLAGRPYRES